MRWAVFWIVAAVATLWNLFGVYDFAQTLADNRDYLRDAPPEMMAWIRSLPMWRMALWGLCLGVGVGAGLALLLRRAMAARLFWVTVALMAAALAYDVAIGGAMRLGAVFLVFSCFLILLEALFALYAGWAARQGMLKRP